MISLDYRTHVIDWKKEVHPFLGRKPTDEEWRHFQSQDPTRRFTRGEEIDAGVLFAGYSKRRTGGMQCFTPEQLEKKDHYQRQHYRKNRDRILKRTGTYQKVNREKCNAYRRSVSADVKKKRVAYQAAWRKRNPERSNGYRRKAYAKRKPSFSPAQRIVILVRDRLRVAVARKLYGREIDKPTVAFLLWLATRTDIDWADGYQIDHIVPLSKCDLTTVEGQIKSNAPENVRWMKRGDNASRGNAMPTQQELDAHLLLVAEWRGSTS